MGYSGLALRHNNAPNKVTTGWIGASWVRSVTGSGIFTLDPTASSTPVNPQVLTLPKADTSDTYFISFRQPIGYDATLAGSYQNLVSIHRGTSSMGQFTYLLGMLGAGATYTDATNGYSFTVNSVGTSSATVSVTTSATSSAAMVQGTFVVTAADAIKPTVLITSPANGKMINGSRVTVTASANDNVGVAKVDFRVNGALQAADTSAPYSFNWNTRKLARGNYTINAVAYDAAGNSASSSVTVTK